MTDLEQFIKMLEKSNTNFVTKGRKNGSDEKIVIVHGRFACDRTMFKFDESGNLYYVGTFDESSIHWNKEFGKFIGGKVVKREKDLTSEQREEYKRMYRSSFSKES